MNTASLQNKPWTQERAIQKLCDHYAREGKIPTTKEWESIQGVPAIYAIRKMFGTWNVFVKRSGLTPKKISWSDIEIIAALQSHYVRTGMVPTGESWQTSTPDHPSSATVRDHFGSWTDALKQADLLHAYNPCRKIWSKDSILASFNRWAAEHYGIYPTARDWPRRQEYWPSSATVFYNYSSWKQAIVEAQAATPKLYMPSKRKPLAKYKTAKKGRAKCDKQQLIAYVRSWKKVHGNWPKAVDWDRDSSCPSYYNVRKYFATWEALTTAAGKKPLAVNKRKAISHHVQQRVFARDNHICQNPYCDKTNPHLSVDHIIPVIRGGTDDLDNLQTLCGTCNSRKGAMEWSVFLSRESERVAIPVAA